MPFLTSVVRVEDASGNRIDTPDANGVFKPIVLQLDPTMQGTASDNGATTKITISAPGSGGGGVVSFADHAAFRAVVPGGIANGQVINFKSPPGTYIYDTTSGAGFADDDNIVLKQTLVSGGSNGRAYNANSAIMPTFAAYRLIGSLGLYQSYQVQAYATKDDGGGGIFDYDSSDVTTADDDGKVLVSGTKRVKRRDLGDYHTKQFGIKGDGSDETAKITNARALALTMGRRLVFAAGIFGITGALALTSGERLIAETPGHTTIKQLTAPTPSQTRNIFTAASQSDIVFDGILFDQNPGTTSDWDTCAIQCTGVCARIRIIGCEFEHFSSAIRGWDDFSDSLISNCTFLEPRGAVDARASGGYFHHNVYLDLNGPQAAPTRDDHIRAIVIEGCQWIGGGTAQMGMCRGMNIGTSSNGVTVSGCTFDQWRHNNIILSGVAPVAGFYTIRNHTITGCTFASALYFTSRGIYGFNGVELCTVTGCTFYNIPGDAIEFQNCNKNTFTGCVFYKCGYYHDYTNPGAADAGYPYGITVAGTNKSGGIRFTQTVPSDCQRNAVKGCVFVKMAHYGIIYSTQHTYADIEGCYFEDCAGPEVLGPAGFVGDAIYIHTDPSFSVRFARIVNCVFWRIGGSAFSISSDASNSDIRDVRISNIGLRHRATISVGKATGNAVNPIVIHTDHQHRLRTGDHVDISGPGSIGNTAMIGNWPVTVIDGNTFTIPTTGNGTYDYSGGNAVVAPTFVLSAATNATPIVITTTTDHGVATGEPVHVSDALGNTAANGFLKAGTVTANTIQLLHTDGSNTVGNGTWTSGGLVSKWHDAVIIGQYTSLIDGTTQKQPDNLVIDGLRVQDDPAIGQSTWHPLMFVGTMAGVQVHHCFGSTFASGPDYGGNTIVKWGNYWNGTPEYALGTAAVPSMGGLYLDSGGSTPTDAQLRNAPSNGGHWGVLVHAADNVAELFDVERVGGAFIARDTSIAAWYKASDVMTLYGSTGNTPGSAATLTARQNVDLSTGFVRFGDASIASQQIDSKGDILTDVGAYFRWAVGNVQSTVGSAGAASALPGAPAGYAKISVNGNLAVVPYWAPS